MSDKKQYDSDTLNQQRRARKEFLELKKMQNGELIDEPQTDASEPATFKKKAQNFWYYNRFLLLAIVFLAVVIGVCVKQCASRIDYDLGITVYTSHFVSDDDCKKIASYFEKYCEDINGDGLVNIQVYNCSYSDGENNQATLAINSKFQAILACEDNCLLFITDDTTTEYLNTVLNSSPILEQDGVFLSEDFYNKCDTDDYFELPENLKISRRITANTTMQKNKTAKACYEASGKILDKISQ